jgi:hypothetical protein
MPIAAKSYTFVVAKKKTISKNMRPKNQESEVCEQGQEYTEVFEKRVIN